MRQGFSHKMQAWKNHDAKTLINQIIRDEIKKKINKKI